MKKITALFLFTLLCCFLPSAYAQLIRTPFQGEIERFKEQDKKQPPPKDAILFVGSSSIRLWKDLPSTYPDHVVINRGFGGSTLTDLKYYLKDIVLPYSPRQVVVYSGENDIATGKVDAKELLARFKDVFAGIRQELPNAYITFVSMKPSPSRARHMPLLEEANALVRDFLQDKPNTHYVDVYSLMLDEQGKPRKELFVEDMLHMNAAGYAIWAEALRPYLLR